MVVINRIKIIILTVLVLSSMILFANQKAVKFQATELEDKELLRLHIKANSDSFQDQKIKREVKEILMQETKKLLADQRKFVTAKQKLNNNLTLLEEKLIKEHDKLNQSYGLKLQLKKMDFPTRSYGDLTIEAGEYHALEVNLGKGQGNNWWCVLFPPFCIVDIEQEEVKLDTQDENKLLAQDNKKVEYRFKFLDYLIEEEFFSGEFLYNPLKLNNE